MKVLIVADHFPPSFAPRMGYLARNLKSLGHEVYVVAITKHRDFNSFDFLTGYADEVHEIDSRELSHGGVVLSTIKGFVTTFRPMWTETDTLYYEKCKEVLRSRHIDCVICSTSSFYPLLVVERIMEEQIPVILDFRDIYEQDETFYPRKGLAGVMRHFQKKIRNRIIKKADAVVSVSKWHCEYLSRWNKRSKTIMNGFDEQRFESKPAWKGEKVRIVYTGTMATPQGDISAHSPYMLFEAIKEIAEGKRERLEVVFYTDSNSKKVLGEVINQFGLERVVKCEDWVKSEKVPAILAESSALLILSNHGKKGVMLTKTFEYMAMNRPIFCLPNPDEQLDHILRETGTGYTMRDKESVKSYIEKLIDGKIEICPDRDAIMEYSRGGQAKQFEQLMKEVIGSK